MTWSVNNVCFLLRSTTVSLCHVFAVQAAQEAVQQVAESSKETASTGKVITPCL